VREISAERRFRTNRHAPALKPPASARAS
jgi:hypothetical protein